MSGRPILVTGAHRSGSTWVGRMLAAAPGCAYIHEPFNLAYRPGLCGSRMPYWFLHIHEGNAEAYRRDLSHCFAFRYRWVKAISACRSLGALSAVRAEGRAFGRNRRERRRPVVKDPIAFFSAEWLAQTFDMQVVLLLRHPAAFAASMLKAGWTHPFEHFLAQPELMNTLLAPYADDIARCHRESSDPLDQAIVLWRVIYGVARTYQQRHPDWIFVRHADLSQDPEAAYKPLFRRLGLAFDDAVRESIRCHSTTDDPAGPKRHGIVRDSRAARDAWRRLLTPDQIARVHDGTQPTFSHFYPEPEWRDPPCTRPEVT